MKVNTRETIKKYKIRLTKSLGQNFLVDDAIINQIVDTADISYNDTVIEIGSGIGNMTAELALKAEKVFAVEIDRYLIPALTDNLKDFANIDIINKDIMKMELKDVLPPANIENEIGGGVKSVKVVANLPYYITTPIIMKLLENNPGIDFMVFMVQKEVADRMVADPGGKNYGALSIAVQYYSKAEKVFDVPPSCFIPQPDVSSTVIKLSIYKKPQVDLLDKELFFKTVKASFAQRRKTLVNALFNSGNFIENKQEIKRILETIGVEEKQRGETLSIMQFAKLSNSFHEKNSLKIL